MNNHDQQLQRIQEMETAFNRYADLLSQTQNLLAQLQTEQETYIRLRDYYTDPIYTEDVTFSNSPAFPANQSSGVLSEDALYNLLDDQRQVALDMLDQASRMLRE